MAEDNPALLNLPNCKHLNRVKEVFRQVAKVLFILKLY